MTLQIFTILFIFFFKKIDIKMNINLLRSTEEYTCYLIFHVPLLYSAEFHSHVTAANKYFPRSYSSEHTEDTSC
jgi:hypothetical protein